MTRQISTSRNYRFLDETGDAGAEVDMSDLSDTIGHDPGDRMLIEGDERNHLPEHEVPPPSLEPRTPVATSAPTPQTRRQNLRPRINVNYKFMNS